MSATSVSWRERVLASRAVAWLDARLGLAGPLARELDRPAAPAVSWPGLFRDHLGALCLLLLAAELLTGLVMLPFYRAGAGEALASLLGIEQALPAGWLVRRLHAVGGHLLLILTGLRALGALARGEHLAPRELGWLTGWLLVLAALAALYSGGLLPQSWVSLGLLQALWPGGSGEGGLTGGSLAWALAAHLGLPLLALPLLWLHLVLQRRAAQAVPAPPPEGEVPAPRPFFPQGLLELGLALAGGLLVLVALAVLWPQPFLAPAGPPPSPGLPGGLPSGLPWYIWAPGLLASWLPPGGGLALLGLALLAPLALPFWGGRGGAWPARLLPLALALWALLSLWGAWRL